MTNSNRAPTKVSDLGTPFVASQKCPRIGFVPYSDDLSHPADRRRFPAYARARGMSFEVAEPGRHYDFVVLSEVADIKTWSNYRHGKLVYDLIDSYLAIPRSDPKQLLRGVAWYLKGMQHRPVLNFPGALARMCRRADAVVCTTREQRQAILNFCSNVHVALDMHEELVSAVKTDYRPGTPFRLVWEGMASNAYQLEIIARALREIAKTRSIELVLVTDAELSRRIPWLGETATLDWARRILNRVRVIPWEAATWADSIIQCDLAIIPIDLSDPLTAGKPANKLALLWRAAMPVVTSATASYDRMHRAIGMEQLSCRNEQDWINALELMVDNQEARTIAGSRGREHVELMLSRDRQLRVWDEVLASLGIDVELYLKGDCR